MTKSDAKALHREYPLNWYEFLLELYLAQWITTDDFIDWK